MELPKSLAEVLEGGVHDAAGLVDPLLFRLPLQPAALQASGDQRDCDGHGRAGQDAHDRDGVGHTRRPYARATGRASIGRRLTPFGYGGGAATGPGNANQDGRNGLATASWPSRGTGVRRMSRRAGTAKAHERLCRATHGLMELGGLEPPTSWVRSRRSPN